jgi:hypothetical protein
MIVEFQVEEPSMAVTLFELAPRLLAGRAAFNVINYGDKRRMLRELPVRLHGYAQRMVSEDIRLLVLVDRDDEDCHDLKARLEAFAARAGLPTKTSCGGGCPFRVVNRIVVEELEAWFFGDTNALRAAYPRVPPTLPRRARYRDPDAIAGGTWETLHRVLRQAGHLGGRFPKVEVARRVAEHMTPDGNRSPSFRAFRDGLEALVQA